MRAIAMLAGMAAAMATAAVPAEAKKAPALTPMEIQALQSHDYETSKEVLFASVVSVFQDLGYQLENADMTSGFITASSAMRNKTSLLDAFAKQTASGNTRVTAFVEAMPNHMARVRLNFLASKTASGMWGQSARQDKPILDAQTYKSAWDKIDEAIFTRAATTGLVAKGGATAIPAPSAPSAPAPAPAPAAVMTPAAGK